MKFFLIAAYFLVFSNNSFSQLSNFDWAKSLDRATGLSFEETYLIGTDSTKNVYVAGNFRNMMDIDPGAGVFNVNSTWDNVFISKLDSNGTFIWGKQIGGDRFTLIKSLCVDLTGNVYSTGRFSGTTDFDPGPAVFNLSATYPSTPECNAIFILKLDNAGNFKWAKQIGGNSSEYTGFAITADKFGNIYTTGYFVGITDLDPGSGVDNQGANGIVNVFVEKLDSMGNYKFAKVFSGNHNANGQYIKTDNYGNIYTSGYFGGTVDFDPGSGVHNITVPFYSFTPFMSKLDSSGNFIWAKENIGNAPFAVDAFQNIVIFDGGFTSLLLKYDVNGNQLWSKTTGGLPYLSYQTSPIVLDVAGNIFLTGMFSNTQDFDPGPGIFNMTATGGGFGSDVFICRLDVNGNFNWAVSFGGYADDYAYSIALDNSGNIYTAGVYIFTVDFDPGPDLYTLTPGIAGGGIFIHKMAHCLNTSSSIQTINTCNSYSLNNITYTSSGMYIQTILNKAGCDSIITLNLTLGGSSDTISATACESYRWNNQVYTLNGIYRDTIITAGGCDSIINLNLTIKNKSTSSINTSICEGQNYLGYTLPGTYIDTLIAANGCDSLRILNLVVKRKKYSRINYTICRGQSYLGHTSSGIFDDTLIAANGCDSIRTLYLKVNPKYLSAIVKTICEGDSYLGHSLSGNYSDTLLSQFGCDSVIYSTLKIMKPTAPKLGSDKVLCLGDSLILSPGLFDTYLWQDGSTNSKYIVRKPGLYSLKATNICGTSHAEINVKENTCKIYFPNAFSPNNDGTNDIFKILNAYNLSDYTLLIYNRYGEKVFETTDYLKGWNGYFKYQQAETGVYIWQCSFKENNTLRNIKGTLILLK